MPFHTHTKGSITRTIPVFPCGFKIAKTAEATATPGFPITIPLAFSDGIVGPSLLRRATVCELSQIKISSALRVLRVVGLHTSQPITMIVHENILHIESKPSSNRY